MSVVKLAYIEREGPSDVPLVRAWERGEATPIAEGISRTFWLHRPAYNVRFWVKNTGGVYGGDVSRPLFPSSSDGSIQNPKIPQLYVNFPSSSGEPPSVLRGFTNTEIDAHAGTWVSITLSRYDLSIWDVKNQGWRKPEGQIGITVGKSSRDKRLQGIVPI